MEGDKENLLVLQKKVIKAVYVVLIAAIIVGFVFSNNRLILSALLGSAISLFFFNSKMNYLQKILSGRIKAKKMPASLSARYLLNYLTLIMVLFAIPLNDKLHPWIVFAYAFSANIFLTVFGYLEALRKRK